MINGICGIYDPYTLVGIEVSGSQTFIDKVFELGECSGRNVACVRSTDGNAIAGDFVYACHTVTGAWALRENVRGLSRDCEGQLRLYSPGVELV